MIFMSGARQVGKTTLAKEIAAGFTNSSYLNWDIIANKRLIIENPTFFENINKKDETIPLVVLDEIHKYKNWKNYLKGIYDQFSADYKFLITGSGRLDLYQKGNDSLAGRYFIFHIFPFTVAELSRKRRSFKEFVESPISRFDLNNTPETRAIWQKLYNVGGFPEPFVKNTGTFWRKWSDSYSRQIINEDIRNIADIKKVDNMGILFSLLPSRVGAPISINNIANDLQVSFDSVKSWLKLFDSFYLTFRISPWTKKVSRAISKDKKLYLYNYPEIKDKGYRFENMVALELQRAIHSWNEHGYGKFSLHYIRNKEKEEVDFLIADQNCPVLMVETKFSEDSPSKSLFNFQNALNIPAVQLTNKENVFKHIKNNKQKILLVTAHRWLSSLP